MVLSGHLLSVLIFFPAFGAAALLLLRGDDHLWIRRLTFVVSVVEFIFSLFLLRAVPINAPGYSLVEFGHWISAPPINYHLGVDGISMFLVILTTFLTPICVLASWHGVHHRIKEFHFTLLASGSRRGRRFPLARPVPLLPLLGDHADPDGIPDRHLGP